MPSEITKRIGAALDRRQFLSRASAVLASFVAGVFGIAPRAHGYSFMCCDLCRDPDSCSYISLSCDSEWCWNCPYECFIWSCKECYQDPCDSATCWDLPFSKAPAPPAECHPGDTGICEFVSCSTAVCGTYYCGPNK